MEELTLDEKKQSVSIISIENFISFKKKYFEQITLTYQIFGRPIGEAEVVLVNHALTGNSEVAGENGWWKSLIGKTDTIDLNQYTVIVFDIPNNQYAIKHDDIEYDDLVVADIARLFILALRKINIQQVFACIGNSLGGCIAWEIALQFPSFAKNIVSIASDWKTSDWVMAQCDIQNSFLQSSNQPIENARKMAMLFYRTPESFAMKFNRTLNETLQIPNVISWLNHHGEKLSKRFSLKAYKTMNYLLSSADVTHGKNNFNELATQIEATIYQIAINTDLLFTSKENQLTHQILKEKNKNSYYFELQSIHGHDAFLIEYKQLNQVLAEIF